MEAAEIFKSKVNPEVKELKKLKRENWVSNAVLFQRREFCGFKYAHV